MEAITFEERCLMSIYNSGTRAGLIDELNQMMTCLASEEQELLELSQSAVKKLTAMTDAEYGQLDLVPDFPD